METAPLAEVKARMANAWTDNGPVSLPPRSLAYGAGVLMVALALAGVALGLRAAWREAGAPDLGGAAAEAAAGDDTLTAKPIVDLPAPVAKAPEARDRLTRPTPPMTRPRPTPSPPRPLPPRRSRPSPPSRPATSTRS